jgi:hypothetical membrane protein
VDTTVDRRSTTVAPGPATPGRGRAVTLAGALLAATGIGIVLSTITNEALYPAQRHYSTFADTISSLSGTEPPDSYIVEPNRLIFIVTMAVAGVLVLAATALLRQLARRRLLIALAVFGIGLIGIAVFPGDVVTWHPIFALTCFVGGSIAAILSRTLLDRPLRAFAVTLGSVALAATVLGLDVFADLGPQTAIGIGGVERWIAYPVLLWMVLFGAALMTVGAKPWAGPQIDAREPGMPVATAPSDD